MGARPVESGRTRSAAAALRRAKGSRAGEPEAFGGGGRAGGARAWERRASVDSVNGRRRRRTSGSCARRMKWISDRRVESPRPAAGAQRVRQEIGTEEGPEALVTVVDGNTSPKGLVVIVVVVVVVVVCAFVIVCVGGDDAAGGAVV